MAYIFIPFGLLSSRKLIPGRPMMCFFRSKVHIYHFKGKGNHKVWKKLFFFGLFNKNLYFCRVINARPKTNKMKTKILIWQFLFLSITILLTSCTGKKLQIGVSQCSGGIWREKVNNEMRLAQYQYNNVNLTFADAENNGKLQARQIDSMIAKKMDLIVVAPDNMNEVTPAIERAYRAKIPVILFDRKTTSSHYTAYIGGNNIEAGREAARFMAEKLHGKGTVVEITGLKDASPVIERHRGFHEVISKYPGIKVVTLDSNWTLERAQELMKQYLDRGGHADGIFGHSDLGAVGAFLECEKRKIDKQVVIVGIDGLPGAWEGVDRVKRGQFAATYVYPTKGEEIMSLAMKILNGKPYRKDNYMESFLATPENCDAIVLQYQELEAKVKDMNHMSNSLDTYTKVARLQRGIIAAAAAIVILLLIFTYYIYKVYKAKLKKQKEVARIFIEDKEGWPSELTHVDESERYFMDRFKSKMLENMSNADLRMDDLGAEMQLSKVQLYRKVKTLTGKTPAELLREMRLQRACALLQQTDKTISEISAEVGFATPGYFSSCFKKKFGQLPTEMRG